MQNIPVVKLGIVAVSRDCFPIELSRKRRSNVVAACKELKVPVVEIETIIENERDVLKALDEVKQKNINALAIYLGNFGPEGPTTLLAQKFSGPVMFVAAAEDSGNDLINGRGDAYCGMLSASYNIGLRRLRPYIPEYPVGDPKDIAAMLAEFIPVARTVIGVRNLKIISFGPRPFDFLTCHAPIQPLFDLGVEIMENSELDLFDLVQAEKGSSDVKRIAGEMAKELGQGNTYPDLNEKLAQYEAALEKYHAGKSGRFPVRRICQQMLAGFREILRPRSLLHELAAGGQRHSRGLRSGYLRSAERVHVHLRDGIAAGHPGHQQLRSQGHVCRVQKGDRRLCAHRPVDGLSLREHIVRVPHEPVHAASADHASPDGAGDRSRTSREERWKEGSRPVRSPFSAFSRRRNRASRPMWRTGKCLT